MSWAESRPGTLLFERSPGFVRTANATDAAVEYPPIGALPAAGGPMDTAPGGGHVVPPRTTAWWSVGG